MKKLIKSAVFAACALFITETVSAAVLVPKSECKNNTCQNFRVGMYRVKNTLTMNFLMEKEKGERITLRLMDSKGKIIHEEVVGRGVRKFGRKFNFAEIQDGHYVLEASDENERILKDIFLATNELIEIQNRSLATVN